jgi:hypothetical protein
VFRVIVPVMPPIRARGRGPWRQVIATQRSEQESMSFWGMCNVPTKIYPFIVVFMWAVMGTRAPLIRTPCCAYSYPCSADSYPCPADPYPLLRSFVPLVALIRTPCCADRAQPLMLLLISCGHHGRVLPPTIAHTGDLREPRRVPCNRQRAYCRAGLRGSRAAPAPRG